MVKINTNPPCQTLTAIDSILEERDALEEQRGYLGMSAIGDKCNRKGWYYFRMVTKARMKAHVIKACLRGHRNEDAQAEYLKMLPNIDLQEVDPETGEQWEYIDIDGHFKGHMDGKILGLIQAPKTWHVWEHKERDEKFFNKLEKLRLENEKTALQNWDIHYYAQAQCYMHYSGLKRHYLTCSKNGCRESLSVRTDYNEADAIRYIEKARRIIASQNPPEKPGWAGSEFYLCRFCDYSEICNEGAQPERVCRTCLHSSPVSCGQWECAKWKTIIPDAEQRKRHDCHRYIPSLVNLKQTDVDGDNVVYEGWIDDGKG